MKLVRYGAKGEEKPGIIDENGLVRDISSSIDDVAGVNLDDQVLGRLNALNTKLLPVVDHDVRLGPCVAGVGKFICIGRNYPDHAAETGSTPPTEPIIFMKATSAITGPNDGITLPRGSLATDWEVELGVVIGQTARYVDESEALDYVAGYCLVNDVSERDFQAKRGGQWVKGKSADTFGPIGPWLVTRDEIADPQNLALSLSVNGKEMQSDTTGSMMFGVAMLVAYVSQFMTLHPGDILSTGTPAGVGMGQKPSPVFLKAGDVVELNGEGLGSQRQLVSQG